jgi:hypothetical protein
VLRGLLLKAAGEEEEEEERGEEEGKEAVSTRRALELELEGDLKAAQVCERESEEDELLDACHRSLLCLVSIH